MRISSGVGISKPTLSLPFCRRSALRSFFRRGSQTTLRETWPRSWASVTSMLKRDGRNHVKVFMCRGTSPLLAWQASSVSPHAGEVGHGAAGCG